jgi:hypothetical protein
MDAGRMQRTTRQGMEAMPHQFSRQPAVLTNAYDATWQRLTPTLRSALAGKYRQFVLYCELFSRCGGRPKTIVVTAAELVASLGAKDPRSGLHWLTDLATTGLIDIRDRDPRSGTFTVYVHPPESAVEPSVAKSDPQADLFNEPDAAVGAHEPPRLAQTAAAVGAHGPPSTNSNNSAQTQSAPFVRPPSFVASQKRPENCDHGTIENKSLNLNHVPIEQPGPHGPWGPGGSRAQTAEPSKSDFDDFDRRRQTAEGSRPPLPKPLGELVAAQLIRVGDQIERAIHPLEQIKKLERLIIDRVNDPDMHRVVAARAAEYVIHDGLPLDALQKALDDLDTTDSRGDIRTTRGTWFGGTVERRIRERGIATRANSKRRAK